MTLSRRNSREINVDGTFYRWAVAARSQHETREVTLIVEPPGNGQRLAVAVPCRDPWLEIETPVPAWDVRSITPGLVRSVIEQCRGTLWAPGKPGPQLDVSCVIAILRDEGGESGTTCHVCWQCPDCEEWFSDDVEYQEQPPLLTSCGWTRHHANGEPIPVMLFW